MTKRKPTFGTLVEVFMVCGHSVFFGSKVKPKAGEIISCVKCNDYKEVK